MLEKKNAFFFHKNYPQILVILLKKLENKNIVGYELIDELTPEIIIRKSDIVENCGYTVYKKKK